MRRVLASLGVALATALYPTLALASASGMERSAATALPVFEQRQDVREVSLPRPPFGPATPHPFCTPAQPICP